MHHLSLFEGARDPHPKAVTWTWQTLTQRLSTHEFLPPTDKLNCEAFSPASFRPGTRRAIENVTHLSLFVADLDALSEQDALRFLECLEARNWAAVVYSTWSNATKPISFRAVLPLAYPVPAQDWSRTWRAISHALGDLSDPACKDPSRLYFGAFAPVGTEEDAFSHVIQGDPVDPSILPAPPAELAPTQPLEKITRDRLERFARSLARKRDERAQEHGGLLKRILAGEPFAEPGDRDTTIFQLGLTLAHRYPDADPQSLAEHFSLSLDLMARQAPDCPTPKDVAYKIKRAQQRLRDEQTAQMEEETERQAQRIRDAFRSDRTHPYTPDELDAIPPRRWILQKGKSYYARVGAAYRGPYVQEEALNALLRDLSPASTAGVDLFTVSPTGDVQPKTLARLIREYGFVADRVVASLLAEFSYFDEADRTIVEAPAPMRKIAPKRHPEIAEWLDALGGRKAHLLRAWIANVTRLESPCSALFLTGQKHLGKSVLAEGLAKLWTARGLPTPLQDVLGTPFNESQLRCPLTFADEVLPTDFRGRVLHAELRKYIQERRRSLRRKFMPSAEVIGASRVIISANNENILATTESLSSHDIGAIVDRFLWIPCRAKAFEVLQRVDTSGWVDRDEIAEHALYLRETDTYDTSRNRFLVQEEDTTLASKLISSDGPRGAVLQFCVSYLLHPERIDSDPRGQYLIRIYQGKLLINVQVLVNCWSTYVTNEKVYTTGTLSAAIGALATEERPRVRSLGGQRPNYRVIAKEHLISWADDKGYATEDQIEAALAKSTEQRSRHLAPN